MLFCITYICIFCLNGEITVHSEIAAYCLFFLLFKLKLVVFLSKQMSYVVLYHRFYFCLYGEITVHSEIAAYCLFSFYLSLNWSSFSPSSNS